ncbi:unnamed protein product, partial [marine sediment metagenome]
DTLIPPKSNESNKTNESYDYSDTLSDSTRSSHVIIDIPYDSWSPDQSGTTYNDSKDSFDDAYGFFLLIMTFLISTVVNDEVV